MRPQSCANVASRPGTVWIFAGLGRLGRPRSSAGAGTARTCRSRDSCCAPARGWRSPRDRSSARDPAHAHAGLPPVGDADALVLAQIPRTDLLGNVHGGTIPVHQGFLVPSVGSCPSVAPRLAGAFGDAHRARGLGEVHAPSSRCSTYRRRRAAHISFLVEISTPLNVQRCSPPRSSFRWLLVT